MLRITILTPSNSQNEIFAQDTTEFQTLRGLIQATNLRPSGHPDGPDQMQYRAYCPNGTWFTVLSKETL